MVVVVFVEFSRQAGDLVRAEPRERGQGAVLGQHVAMLQAEESGRQRKPQQADEHRHVDEVADAGSGGWLCHAGSGDRSKAEVDEGIVRARGQPHRREQEDRGHAGRSRHMKQQFRRQGGGQCGPASSRTRSAACAASGVASTIPQSIASRTSLGR